MSPTDGTGRMPRPIKYRLYSARVQLVPSGMGAQTSKRKALPSGAAMAAASKLLLESMRPRLPGGLALPAADSITKRARRMIASILLTLAHRFAGLVWCSVRPE